MNQYYTHLAEKYKSDLYPLKPDQISETILCPVNFFTYYHLYVIKNNDNGLYKIGITKNINNRFGQLRTQSGCNLTLIFDVLFEQGYDEKIEIAEKYLHEYFKEKRVKNRGEWFSLNLRDLVKIKYWANKHLELNIYEKM